MSANQRQNPSRETTALLRACISGAQNDRLPPCNTRHETSSRNQRRRMRRRSRRNMRGLHGTRGTARISVRSSSFRTCQYNVRWCMFKTREQKSINQGAQLRFKARNRLSRRCELLASLQNFVNHDSCSPAASGGVVCDFYVAKVVLSTIPCVCGVPMIPPRKGEDAQFFLSTYVLHPFCSLGISRDFWKCSECWF
jgi:hypothetical protein